jgi:guanylate kinase
VFIAPPSWDALAQRLTARASETAGGLARRLEVARREIEAVDEYDYVIINDQVDEAVEVLAAIITAEQARPSRVDVSHLRRQAGTTQ